jgi:hypothetical protein
MTRGVRGYRGKGVLGMIHEKLSRRISKLVIPGELSGATSGNFTKRGM